MIELNFPNPVRQEKWFFGRKAELRRIEQAIQSNTLRPIVLFGERRMGKTSLMNIVTYRLQDRPQLRVVPLFPATLGIYSFNDLAREILHSLCEFRGTSLVERGLVDDRRQFCLTSMGQFFSEARALLRESPASLHLLCIDEFDNLLHNCVTYSREWEARKVLDLSRELQRQAELSLSLFLTLSRVPDIFQDSFHSAVTDHAERIDLDALSPKETDDLLDGLLGDQVTLPPREKQELKQLAGGHPDILKLILSRILALLPDGEYPLQVRASLFERAVADSIRSSHARTCLDNILLVHFDAQERNLMTLLAGLGDRISPRQLDRTGPEWQTAARSLLQRGYLTQSPGGEITFRSTFWGHWLRQQPNFQQNLYRLEDIRRRLEVEIEIHPSQHRVLLRGQVIHFPPGEYQALAFLCQHAGQLVSRDQLAEHLWPKAEGGVTEGSIDAIIHRLRRRLGDSGRQQRYLETRPGEGFILHRAWLADSPLSAKEFGND